jgi:protein-tyrosine-phosphatase
MVQKLSRLQLLKPRGGKCNIVVVCHANCYRSPLVAGLLMDYLKGTKVGIISRGVRPDPATFSKPAAKKIRDFAANNSGLFSRLVLDYLMEHRSEPATLGDLRWADVVVYMDGGNLVHLQRFDFNQSKCLPLGQYAKPPVKRIADPAFIRSGTEELQSLLLSIVGASRNLSEYLREQWLL